MLVIPKLSRSSSVSEEAEHLQGLRQRLCTLEENEEEGDADGVADLGRHQSSEQQQADQCAADLLRTNSLITLGALDTGKRSIALYSSSAHLLDPSLIPRSLQEKHAQTCMSDVWIAAAMDAESSQSFICTAII